jgi:hypothetical protein
LQKHSKEKKFEIGVKETKIKTPKMKTYFEEIGTCNKNFKEKKDSPFRFSFPIIFEKIQTDTFQHIDKAN